VILKRDHSKINILQITMKIGKGFSILNKTQKYVRSKKRRSQRASNV
jgi:hypothetical protein